MPADPLYPWLMPMWQRFMEQVAQDRLPHALIVSGAQGLGKRRLVEHLATALLCHAPSTDPQRACGRCRACSQVAAHSHPDLIRVVREEGAKEITIGAIRTLVRFAGLKAQYGGRRVAIIDEAQRMNPNAANALLKTLEEPTAGAYLILITEQPLDLLPTLRSRCQQHHCPPASEPLALAWLGERLSDPGQALPLLRLAGHAPLAALSLAEPEQMVQRAQLFEALSALVGGEREPIALAEEWLDRDPHQLHLWLYHACADLMRLRAGADLNQLRHSDQVSRLQHLCEQVNLPRLGRLLDRMEQTLPLLRTTVNPQLLLEETFSAWAATWHSAATPAETRDAPL